LLLAQAQTAAPPTITPAGSVPLELLGEANRVHLAGLEELYRIALYAKPPFDDVQMVSEDVAKALRIEVTYERDWRRPPVLGWHRELVARLLEPGAAEHLHQVFAPLRRSDIVLIEYAPRHGTTVHVNRSTAVLRAPHELMLAFLDHWLGQRPVSEEVKRALLDRS
jgi:Chalcone isomerase-like